MKVSKFATALAILGMVLPAPTFAEGDGAVPSTSAAYDSYYQQDQPPAPPADVKSPSDAPAAPAPAPRGADVADAAGCGSAHGNGCDCCDDGCEKCCNSLCGHERCCELDCPEADVFRLIGERCFLGCHKYNIDGYLNFGGTANFDSPTSNFNGVMGYNDRDELQMNQALVTLHRDIDAENCGWAWGGKAQLIYGTDARFIQSFGLELHQDGSNKWNGERFYQLAMPELFLSLAYDDWQMIFGKFVTNMTLETIDVRTNFFYSHSYAFLYAVPFTHTGAYVTRPLQNRNGHWAAGFFRGWERWEDDNDDWSFMGHVQFDNEDKTAYLKTGLCTGDELGFNGIDDNRTVYTIIYSRKFACDRWQYIFVHDGGWQQNGVTTGATTDDAEWYAFSNYLIYQINCCWSAGARLEVFRDDDGTRVAAPLDPRSVGGVPFGMSGNPNTGPYEGNFWGLTAGLNWKPNDNLVVRPEVRYDWFEGTGSPFDDGFADDQLTAAVDLIINW